jgi:hypothetical protein
MFRKAGRQSVDRHVIVLGLLKIPEARQKTIGQGRDGPFIDVAIEDPQSGHQEQREYGETGNGNSARYSQFASGLFRAGRAEKGEEIGG